MKCPCCGHEMEEPPVTMLPAMPWSSAQQRVVDFLVERYPRTSTIMQIVDAVYPYGSGPDCEEKVVRVFLTQIRKKLEGSGWAIPGGKGGRGYGSVFRLERVQ